MKKKSENIEERQRKQKVNCQRGRQNKHLNYSKPTRVEHIFSDRNTTDRMCSANVF